MLVGEYSGGDVYEPQFARALRRQGCEVIEVSVGDSIGSSRIVRWLHIKLAVGPGLYLANRKTLARAREIRPEVILAWRGWWLAPKTIRVLAEPRNRVVAIYNNDDPFGPDARWRMWKRFRSTISFADVCFAYREVNLHEYKMNGATEVHLLMSGFDPAIHRPPSSLSGTRDADVTFVGHYEPDGRVATLLSLAGAGFTVRVYGPDWRRVIGKSAPSTLKIHPAVHGEDYVDAIASARTALVFLSTRNRDMYTRRCFEIPAIGTVMVAPRNRVMSSLYRDGEEAVFFGSNDELLQRVEKVVGDESVARTIAEAGRRRALNSRYDVDARAVGFLQAVLKVRK